MTITENPNAAHRDGARETELRELGIDTPVIHDGRGNVTITVPVRTLDQIIGSDGLLPYQRPDDDELDQAYEDGYEAAKEDAEYEVASIRSKGRPKAQGRR